MQQGISSRFSIGTKRLIQPTPLVQTNIQFKSISSGRGHVIGLAKDGSVWHWTNHLVIQKVNIDVKIAQVAANWDHSSILSENGMIYIVSMPMLIGFGDDLHVEPTEVVTRGIRAQDLGAECDDVVVQIAGLDGFTLALTRFGQVFKLNTTTLESVRLVHFGSVKNEYNSRNGVMNRFITGAFRNFAVYTKESVMLGTIHADKGTLPNRIQELENHEIVKVTFGE